MVAKRQIIKGDKNDKDFQRQIIDNLVYKVYVSDDNTTVYLNIKGGQNIETLEFSEHSEKMETIKNGTNGVRTLSPLSRQFKKPLNLVVFIMPKPQYIVSSIYLVNFWSTFIFTNKKNRVNLSPCVIFN